jgi:hypothetical protein
LSLRNDESIKVKKWGKGVSGQKFGGEEIAAVVMLCMGCACRYSHAIPAYLMIAADDRQQDEGREQNFQTPVHFVPPFLQKVLSQARQMQQDYHITVLCHKMGMLLCERAGSLVWAEGERKRRADFQD